MAEAAATNIPSDASSIAPSKAQDISPFVSPFGKPRSTDFLKPDSPHKRRRSGESPGSSATSPKLRVSPPTWSAAQALIEQRKQRQTSDIVPNRQTSPNPALAVISALQGRQMVSEKSSDNALSPASGGVAKSEPLAAATTLAQKSEESRTGVAQMQRSLTPSSSLAPGEEGPPPTVIEGNGISIASLARIGERVGNDEGTSAGRNVHQPLRQETDPGEGRLDKALTYPGPLPNFQQSDRRRNTHAGYGRESPSQSPGSNKKHQCLMYTGEASHEPEKMDDEIVAGDSRKGSLPSIQRHDAPNYLGTDGHTSYAARQPSTYPPIAGRQPNPGGLYPPMASPGAGSSTSNSPRQTSFSQGSVGSSFPPPPNQNVFAQGVGMTESPKPLSPGSHQLGHPEQNINRNRSPSLTQQYQQQQYGRKASMQNTSTAMSLPPMPPSGHSGAPHLPSLPGLPPPDLRFTLHSQAGGPPPVHPSAQGSGPAVSSPSYPSPSANNSLSSQSGDGSQKLYGSDSAQLFAYIRSLEVKVDRLQEEVGTLKSQLSASR
ncbi:MAG: hypothetical protein Q9209_005576 [Squamulea sp. 1 TL-2023]